MNVKHDGQPPLQDFTLGEVLGHVLHSKKTRIPRRRKRSRWVCLMQLSGEERPSVSFTFYFFNILLRFL